MEILKFGDFLNEQVKEQDVMVNDYTNKPNLKDPKTDKDFIELITKYLSVIRAKRPNSLKDPVEIAMELRNLLTSYLNVDFKTAKTKDGFKKRTGGIKLPKALMVLNKFGEEKEQGWAAKGK